MNNFDIAFSRPWFLLLLIPALFLAIWPYTRIPRTRRRTVNRLASLVSRLLVLLIVTSMLAGVSFYTATDQTEVLIVVDLSDSTAAVQASMKQYISAMLDQAGAKNKVGIVTFAYDSIYAAALSSDHDDVFSDYLTCRTVPNESATDLASTLYYAETLFSESANRRIILLTDGEQTDGDAAQAAAAIAADGVRVDAVYFDTAAADAAAIAAGEVQINTIGLPANAAVGDTVQMAVTLQSSLATSGTLLLYDNDNLIAEIKTDLASGINEYTTEYTVTASGLHAFSAQIQAADDTISENNLRYACLDVSGAANILILDGAGQESEQLAAYLASEYAVTVASAAQAPQTMDELRIFDEVILMNVSNDDLPAGFADLLAQYVSELGGGVLTTGGENTYMYGSMLNTAFADFLPVDLQLDDTQTVALMLVIDTSSSMSGANLTMAKAGAINSVNSLSDSDFVGVITFNAKATVVADLTSVTGKESIIADINKLSTVRGTYLNEAANEAYQALKDFDADIKHVIILSDGKPSDSGYAKVIKTMADAGITTSTICVGSGADTAEMEELAEIGGGRFYSVSSVSDLPEIMLTETIASQGDYFNDVAFVPTISSYTTALNGVAALPELDGYNGTSLKDGATLVLYTDVNKPVYAEWQYGLGQVGSLTSVMGNEKTAGMLATNDGVTFVRNVIAGLLPDSPDVSGIYLTLTSGNYTAQIQAAVTLSADQALTATVVSPQGTMTTLALNATAANLYEGALDTSVSGLYTITVQQVNSDGTIADATQKALAASYSAEYDAFAPSGGESLLINLCQLSGGEVMTTAKELFSVKPNWVEREMNAFLPMLIAVIALFLADIVLRKFKLKKPRWWLGWTPHRWSVKA